MHLRSALSRARAGGWLLAGSLLASACGDLTVPDYNNPSLESYETNPTPGAVNTLATGLLIGARRDLTDRTSYIPQLGIIGRESYTLDGADPRYVSELLVGPLSNSGAFGGGLWNLRYQNIRNANILLAAVDRVQGMSDAQKEAIRGFAKTIQAHDFLLVINTRDTNGAPIEVSGEIRGAPAPLAGKAQVFAHIVRLLDEADAHLQAGGGAFPFPLSSGFTGLNTPATFRQFNRGLKARVDVYTGRHAQALTDLAASFVSTSAPLSFGAYHTFDSRSGDDENLLTSPTLYAHPAIVAEAQRQPGGELDRRVQAKVRTVDPRTVSGLTSDLQFTAYAAPNAPVPILRNEELILLRAEARWFTGDRAGALADLNAVRQSSGGLAPLAAPAGDADFVTALLRERRYSLLMEGGHRWIDHRRFGRLDQLPRDQPTHTVHRAFLVPENECLARGASATCDLS